MTMPRLTTKRKRIFRQSFPISNHLLPWGLAGRKWANRLLCNSAPSSPLAEGRFYYIIAPYFVNSCRLFGGVFYIIAIQ